MAIEARTYAEHEGTLSPPEEKLYTCRQCGRQTATCQEWESSCGGYEDYKYTCTDAACGYVWWVDGIDS